MEAKFLAVLVKSYFSLQFFTFLWIFLQFHDKFGNFMVFVKELRRFWGELRKIEKKI